jgi:formamidopyrimidine-DNA glycosylase
MPEIPDLEAISGFLNRRLPGVRIERAQALIPVVFRVPKDEFEGTLGGNVFGQTTRRGKFLLFDLESGHKLVVNPMLTGRFQYVTPEEKRWAKTCMLLALADGQELRYSDERLMGKVYLVPEEDLGQVPQFAEMGPDALDESLTEEVFAQRLRRHNGMIKSILVNHRFVAGIGNAYADEILWAAGLHPYRKRPTLSDEDIHRLYEAVRSVLGWAIAIVAERMKDGLVYEEVRDHLRVHRRGGQPCPVCGTRISEITAGQRITSFCRNCQK